MDRTETVLALRALGLGDLLTALPALRGLRRTHPTAHIMLAAPGWLAPVAAWSAAVDELVPTSGLVPAPAPDRRLPRAGLAANLHGSGPESTALLRATGPGRLLGYGVTARWRADEHEVHRWCRLLTEAGIGADPADLALPRPTAASAAPDAVVVHPGAAYGSRRWPARCWSVVARELDRRGLPVVLTGSPAEVPLAAAVARGARLPARTVLAGRTGLPALAATVAHARCVLSADTGVAHLATALGVPSVILFGPAPPSRWGPPPDRPWHRVLWAGRTGDPFTEQPDPGLLTIGPEQVLAGYGEALARAPVEAPGRAPGRSAVAEALLGGGQQLFGPGRHRGVRPVQAGVEDD